MRQIEVRVDSTAEIEIRTLIERMNPVDYWIHASLKKELIFNVLLKDNDSKALVQILESEPNVKRLVIHSIEGTLPKPPEETKVKGIRLGKFSSISKEELYIDIDQPVNLSWNFILMVILSSFVAGIGILKGNVAIIIGAMVIAPFLGPNMSMAFGTTLGDVQIIRKSIVTGLVSTGVAVLISILWGLMADNIDSIIPDSLVAGEDIILALVCGFAGVITIISGQGTTLVGVMVAASLLPPLMRSGLFLGGGDFPNALNSMFIFTTNIICLNVAGIITFYLAGIRPRLWWDKEKAKKKTRQAFIYWMIALTILTIVIYLWRTYFLALQ